MEDLSDIEREEQLRRWWSENWAWIIGGVALGLSMLAGWQYWQRYQVQSAERDEAGYVAVIEALVRNDRDEAVSQAKALRERRPDSPYADQAELALARAALERRDFDDAAGLLRSVAERSKDVELREMTRIRLARVLIEQGKHDEALTSLDAAAGAFAPLVQEVRGDAYAAKGDAAAALKEYEAALAAAGQDSALDREFVELNRDAQAQVSTAPASVPAAAGAPAAPESPSPEAATK